MVQKPIRKALKRLHSLVRTKLELAKGHKTLLTRPSPLPLVKGLAGVELKSLEEVEAYLPRLKERLLSEEEGTRWRAVIEALDIIEGVKYEYEPVLDFPELVGPSLELPEPPSAIAHLLRKLLEGDSLNLSGLELKVSGGGSIRWLIALALSYFGARVDFCSTRSQPNMTSNTN